MFTEVGRGMSRGEVVGKLERVMAGDVHWLRVGCWTLYD